MKPLHELLILNHFYYCFLLAIKLRKCNLPSVNDIREPFRLSSFKRIARGSDKIW